MRACGGLHKTPVGASAFVVFCSATFFVRWNAPHSFIAHKKRRIQPERYMTWRLKWLGNCVKRLRLVWNKILDFIEKMNIIYAKPQ
jgi:hypothetical protein